MAQSGRFSHKLEESDDDFNSNQFSPETATLSVLFLMLSKKKSKMFHIFCKILYRHFLFLIRVIFFSRTPRGSRSLALGQQPMVSSLFFCL